MPIVVVTKTKDNKDNKDKLLIMDYRHREVPLCDELLGWSNFSVQDFPRFREAVVEEREPWIVVHTRTGGGNRGEYSEEINQCKLLCHFDHEEDDGFDRTYMYFWYRVHKQSMDTWCEFANKTKEEFPDSTSSDDDSNCISD